MSMQPAVKPPRATAIQGASPREVWVSMAIASSTRCARRRNLAARATPRTHRLPDVWTGPAYAPPHTSPRRFDQPAQQADQPPACVGYDGSASGASYPPAIRACPTTPAPSPARSSIWTRPGVARGAVIVGGWTLIALSSSARTSRRACSATTRCRSRTAADRLAARLVHFRRADARDSVAGRSFPVRTRPLARNIAIHPAGARHSPILQLALEAAITVWTRRRCPSPRPARSRSTSGAAALGFHGSFLSLLAGGRRAGAVAVQSGIAAPARARGARADGARCHLETQVVQARLGALKMQLQPHFLFNTLNAVVSLVRARRGREAEDTLAHLSDLLRWVLDDREHAGGAAGARARVRAALSRRRGRPFADRLRVDSASRPTRSMRRAAPVPAADRRERDSPRHRGELHRRRDHHQRRSGPATRSR